MTTTISPSTIMLDGAAPPRARFRKAAISVGDYTHPKTGQALMVTRERIDGWVSRLKTMRAAGIEIPTPAGHSDRPEDNRGWVLDARRDGDTLYLDVEAIGEDAITMASRNRISLFIDPDYRDERGQAWGDVIAHAAYTPVPVIQGHGEFEPIAASRTGGRASSGGAGGDDEVLSLDREGAFGMQALAYARGDTPPPGPPERPWTRTCRQYLDRICPPTDGRLADAQAEERFLASIQQLTS